jgi:tRNA nucleotidyltransferase (CCA-adding enzyme)
MDQSKTIAILHHCVNDDLLHLRSLFQAEGFDIRIVGGAVRDILCGETPKDIDLCTDAYPDEAIAIYDKAGLKHVPTGIDHGTISVVMDSGVYEITSLRYDTETDGRHAKVTFTRQWYEDLARRDLTINAMSMTFDGVLDDPYQGAQDLENHVVRFVGSPELRIQEDYLRILRYFRFAGRFGYMMFREDQITAISKHASGLRQVSRERVWQEVSKMMKHFSASAVYDEMGKAGVLAYCDLPPISAKKMERLGKASTFSQNAAAVFATLFDSPDDAVSYAKKLKISTDDMKLMKFVAHVVNSGTGGDLLTGMKYAIAIDNVPFNHVIEALKAVGEVVVASHLQVWRQPKFPVSGDDMIAAGMKPGKEIGQALDNAKHLWFMSDFTATKDDLLARVLPKEA